METNKEQATDQKQTLAFISDEKLSELKAKHKMLWHIEIEGNDFLLKKPNGAEYERAFSGIADDDKRFSALKTLAVVCIVYPERPQVNLIFEEMPGHAVKLGNLALEMAGTKAEANKKKL